MYFYQSCYNKIQTLKVTSSTIVIMMSLKLHWSSLTCDWLFFLFIPFYSLWSFDDNHAQKNEDISFCHVANTISILYNNNSKSNVY